MQMTHTVDKTNTGDVLSKCQFLMSAWDTLLAVHATHSAASARASREFKSDRDTDDVCHTDPHARPPHRGLRFEAFTLPAEACHCGPMKR